MTDISTFGDVRFRDINRCRQVTSVNNEGSDADIGSATGTGSNGAVTGRYLTQLFLGTDSGSGQHALAQTRIGHDGVGTDENGYFSIHTNSGAEGTPNIAAGESLTERLSINAAGLVRVFGDLQVDGNLDVTGGIQFTDNQITIHTVAETTLRDVGYIAQRSKDATSGATAGTATEAITGATVFAANTVTFPVGVVGDGTDDYYNGWFLKVGAEIVKVTDFVGATRVATIDPAWGLQPTNGAAVDAYAQSHVGTFYDESTDRIKFAYIADNSADEFTYQGNVDVEAKNWDLEGTLNVDDTTDSTSTSTGSAVLAGGLGVAKAMFVGDGDDSTSISTGEAVVNGGTGISANLYVGGNLRVTDAAESDSSTSGSAVFTGGVGVGANISISGNLVVEGDSTNLSTANLQIEDKLIEIGVPESPTVPDDALTADGGGFALQATTDKTITYSYSATGAIFNTWDSSESIAIPLDRALYFGDAETDGTWRVRDNGSDFLRIERREAGTYNSKWHLYSATVGGGGGGGYPFTGTNTYTEATNGLPAITQNINDAGFAKGTADRYCTNLSGTISVYSLSGTWSLEQSLNVNSDIGLTTFNMYHNMSEDGTSILVHVTINASNDKSIVYYTQSGGTWTYQYYQVILTTVATTTFSGSPDNTRFMMSEQNVDIRIYTNDGSTATFEDNFVTTDTYQGNHYAKFNPDGDVIAGSTVAGNTLVIGNRTGSTWTFSLESPGHTIAVAYSTFSRDVSKIFYLRNFSDGFEVRNITGTTLGSVVATLGGVTSSDIIYPSGTQDLERIVVRNSSGDIVIYSYDGVSTIAVDVADLTNTYSADSFVISWDGNTVLVEGGGQYYQYT
jgi:hypothetical protein